MFHFINIFMEVTWKHGSRRGRGSQSGRVFRFSWKRKRKCTTSTSLSQSLILICTELLASHGVLKYLIGVYECLMLSTCVSLGSSVGLAIWICLDLHFFDLKDLDLPILQIWTLYLVSLMDFL